MKTLLMTVAILIASSSVYAEQVEFPFVTEMNSVLEQKQDALITASLNNEHFDKAMVTDELELKAVSALGHGFSERLWERGQMYQSNAIFDAAINDLTADIMQNLELQFNWL